MVYKQSQNGKHVRNQEPLIPVTTMGFGRGVYPSPPPPLHYPIMSAATDRGGISAQSSTMREDGNRNGLPTETSEDLIYPPACVPIPTSPFCLCVCLCFSKLGSCPLVLLLRLWRCTDLEPWLPGCLVLPGRAAGCRVTAGSTTPYCRVTAPGAGLAGLVPG